MEAKIQLGGSTELCPSPLSTAKNRVLEIGLIGTWYPMVNGLFERWKTHVETGSELGGYYAFLALLTAAVVGVPLAMSLRRRNHLILFYDGIVGCWTLGNISESAHSAGFAPAFAVSLAAAAFLSACGAVWAFLLALRSADELQRRINERALSFAFTGSLLVVLGYAVLEGITLPHLRWLWVCALMVVLWTAGLFFYSWRYR
jgi:hypothetical protein